jgi:hypothetical protein
MAKALLAREAKRAAVRLAKLDLDQLNRAFDETIELPRLDVSLQVPLPRLSSPAFERLRALFEQSDPDPDDIDNAIEGALPHVDSPEARAGLVHAVAALAQARRIDPDMAAAAVLELADEGSIFMRSSLIESVAVATGSTPTPTGLLVSH